MRLERFMAFAASLTIDRDGVIGWADDDCKHLLGVAAGVPLVGSRLADILHTSPERIELGTVRGDGTVFDVGTLQIIVRTTDDPNRFTVSVENRDASAAAWHRFQLSQATLDRFTDMVIWLDPDGRYVFVNPAATALLGYSAEELSRLRVVDIDPLFDEQRWREHWQDVVERKSFTIETVNTTKSGVDVPIEVTVNYVEYDGQRYNCSIVRDITERKRFESQLLELNQRITQLSITDDLTGIANRRQFDAVLAEQIDLHAGAGLPMSVLMLDVDHFKAFNDHYGHTAGDECLRSIADVVARLVEAVGGIAARYGGEEFLCLLPASDESVAAALAERVQEAIVALNIPHAASTVADAVTASLGVLTARPPFHARDILNAVDAQLYRAKSAGRNQIAIEGAARPGTAAARPKIDS